VVSLNSVHIIAAILGATLSFTIVFLTRRNHISPLVAARWFALALLVFLVGFFPSIVDMLGEYLGVGYPPIIPLLIALGAAMVKILLMDIEHQRLTTKIDRLVQRMALLEQSVEERNIDSSDTKKRKEI